MEIFRFIYLQQYFSGNQSTYVKVLTKFKYTRVSQNQE